MPADPTPPDWLTRVPKWARHIARPHPGRPGTFRLLGRTTDGLLGVCALSGEDMAMLDGEATAAQLRDLADMMEPQPLTERTITAEDLIDYAAQTQRCDLATEICALAREYVRALEAATEKETPDA